MMEWFKAQKGLLFLAAGVMCLLVAGSIVASFSGRWEKKSSGAVAGPVPFTVENSPESEKTFEEEQNHWVIYITGAVMRPGVYTLPSETRVYQAVEQAGGFTSEADPEAFNMALPLADGVHIHVPRKGEASSLETYAPTSPQNNSGTALIDINRADARTLESLPGIGPAIAQEIIRHREERGRFTNVEDLLSVKGIGPAKLSAIRDLVTVSR